MTVQDLLTVTQNTKADRQVVCTWKVQCGRHVNAMCICAPAGLIGAGLGLMLTWYIAVALSHCDCKN